jgi:hypothetical protein
MTNEAMAALEAELLRQNAALTEFNDALRSLGDVELQVPAAFLEELDEVTQVAGATCASAVNGIRG